MRATNLTFLKKFSLLVITLDSKTFNELLNISVFNLLTNGNLEEGASNNFIVSKVRYNIRLINASISEII